MKVAVYALMLMGTMFAASAALAGSADDAKWIAQCIQDNKDEKAPSADVVVKYCSCMTNKMDDSETKTVTQWEKSHATERKACENESGWK